MKSYSFFLLGLLPAILASCRAYVEFTTNQPPNIVLENFVDTLHVYNLYDSANAELNQDQKKALTGEAYGIFLKDLDSLFNQKLHVSIILSDSLARYFTAVMKVMNRNNPAEPVTMEKKVNEPIEPLARKIFINSRVPYLLFISNYSIGRDSYIEVNEESEGSKEKIAHYFVISQVIFSLYSSPGVLKNQFTATRSTEIDSRRVLSGLLAIGPQLKNFGGVMKDQAEQLAEQYLQQFFNQQVTVSRFYYYEKELKPLASLMKEKQWDQAIRQLTELYNKPKSVSPRHVAYNLSIAYEALGNSAEADIWKHLAGK